MFGSAGGVTVSFPVDISQLLGLKLMHCGVGSIVDLGCPRLLVVAGSGVLRFLLVAGVAVGEFGYA